MIESSKLNFEMYHDKRKEEGFSGPLGLATTPTGQKYIVKYAHPHDAANEFVASWLGEKLELPVPRAELLKPSAVFPKQFAVAIEFIEELVPLYKGSLTDEMRQEAAGQLAFNLLICNSDDAELCDSGQHVYSIDFAESFNIDNDYLILASLQDSERAIQIATHLMHSLREHLSALSFNYPDWAEMLGLPPDEMKKDMIATVRKVLDISEEDILQMSDELSNIFRPEVAVYYECCIEAMQEKAKVL